MKAIEQNIILSAGDLSGHIACKHLTSLDQAGAKGMLKVPGIRDPALAILQERGFELEQQYLAAYKHEGRRVSEPGEEDFENAFQRTIAAMQSGVDVIYQASLRTGMWQGRADFLIKVYKPGSLEEWSYEVLDTKLARETRIGTIVQLCLYSEMLAGLQGQMPEYMHVVTPGDDNPKFSYRLDDFLAYYRFIKKRLIVAVNNFKGIEHTYPTPCSHCEICNWWQYCDAHRRKDDHLSFVAGLANSHIVELTRQEVSTLEGLAAVPLPLPFRPQKGAIETYERLREQARVQMASRTSGNPIFEVVDLAEGQGFFKLPVPSPGDIFFDFEGDPFVGNTGLEYLFGWVTNDTGLQYERIWGLSPGAEKKAFEIFVDLVMERWREHPDMHIYHFTAYEPSALKRLTGKHASRENEIDQMLRGGLFIDLHTITKQAIRAGVETYSLKELEKFHGFEREQELREASAHLRIVERHIERNQSSQLPDETIAAVEAYNKDDCLSTMQLRDWLENLRLQLESSGQVIGRPALSDGAASEEQTEQQQKITTLIESLIAGIPVSRAARSNEQQARWLLANMLNWYQRERKATSWEYFRLRDLPASELMEEKKGLGNLMFTGKSIPDKKSVIDEYSFPAQDYEIREDDDVYAGEAGTRFGTIVFVDHDNQKIKIRKGPSTKDIHPPAVFAHTNIRDTAKEQAIERIAEWVLQNDIDSTGDYRAGRDLLLNRSPRTSGEPGNHDDPQIRAVDWVSCLNQGVLPIQGPPGAGKSHTAAEMILALIQAGKKVGITALSHKVVTALMQKVIKAAAAKGVQVNCMRKVSQLSQNPDPAIKEEVKNETVAVAIRNNSINLLGGTAWLWARQDLASSVDVLFVDEAGQLSLIDTIAVSQAASSLVLLGDPQQLKQPQQGSHPEGTEVSALEHILGEHKTIPDDKGIFLDTTWRMHPSICSFISELFYESRLRPKENLINQRIDGLTEFEGAGLYFREVDHEGNQSSSMEEASYIRNLVTRLTDGKVFYTDSQKIKKVLTVDDIKVITPYNAQVNLLLSFLPAGIQIGTVDKFQGQEAPVVIFSMATSAPADAPRGMEFLYSANRFNVAVSRARAAFILVSSPRLFDPDCKSVAQMKLANAFCRFLEMVK